MIETVTCGRCGMSALDGGASCAASVRGHIWISAPALSDLVNHPPHYKDRVPSIECIEVTKHFNFCRGNAIKYIWRAGMKEGGSEAEDLEKAIWYLKCEIESLKEKK
jgi:Protein of unknwon function (DUF3310)